MSNKVIAPVIGFIVVIIFALVTFNAPKNEAVLGSVEQASEYFSTTTYNHNGAVNIRQIATLKNTPGALGSVVITGAVAGSIKLYDATSTVTNTEWATTTIATIPASAAAGTYTFDVILRKGLVVEFSSATALPTSTITWR